ncbi:MAG: hypothetical protein J6Y65_02230, partial [Eggerthellaceae bacterium]|nr:hypothetical protein [Eggerthellaceae bacterium]
MVDETKETEELEYEINDDDIVAYLVDEDDTEIGFVVMEDGVEVEYYYTEEQLEEDRRAREAAAAKKSGKKNKFDALSNTISRENVKEAAKDMNAIYRDG